MALCCTWYLQAHRIELATIFFAGGVLAYPLTWMVVHLLRDRPWWVRLTIAFLSLNLITVIATALLTGLAEWTLTDPWQGSLLSREGPGQFLVALLSAAYRFAVIGTRHFLPLGLMFLLAASVWLARRAH